MASQKTQSQDVLFYVLNSTSQDEREAFVCKLINTIYQKDRLCDVRFASLDDARRFDRKLWDWKPTAFIPHAVQKEYKAPIQLYAEAIQTINEDVLINLHPEFPECFQQYQRTIEVLDQSAFLLQMGRERWKAYKAQGIEPTVHKIGF